MEQLSSWPDAARHIARLNNNTSDPPTIVLLVRYWSEIPPPKANGSYYPQPWHANIFFEYGVKSEDLK